MKILRHHLDEAVDNHILTKEQAIDLWTFLQNHPETSARFTFTNVLYYLGGLIAICAMSLFMTLGWEAFGGMGIFFISMGYAGLGLKLATYLQNKQNAIPAGICATFAVVMTPLAIYGLQQGMGLWPIDSTVYREYHQYIKWHWIFMELGTLLAGVFAIWRYRYSFLVMPIAVTLWYMTMDVASMLADGGFDYELLTIVSLWFGLIIILIAFLVDFRTKTAQDYAFWLYLAGVASFWSGLSGQYSDNELDRFIYFCINLGLIIIGAILLRRVFVAFGALGCTFYLGYLSFKLFEDSMLFPFVLSFIGFGIIYLGILWQRYERTFTTHIRKILPVDLQAFLERKQE